MFMETRKILDGGAMIRRRRRGGRGTRYEGEAVACGPRAFQVTLSSSSLSVANERFQAAG